MFIDDLRSLTKQHWIGLGIIFAIMLIYVIAISAAQHTSFEQYQQDLANQPEMVYLQDTEGKIHAVPKADYDAANEQWRRDHPNEY